MNWKSTVGVGVGLVAVVAIGLLVREALEPPAPPAAGNQKAPLTDVARNRPPPAVLPVDSPPAGDESQPVSEPQEPVLPEDMPDPSEPPQWTKPLAVPGLPVPPDPFVPPPIEVDHEHGREPSESH